MRTGTGRRAGSLRSYLRKPAGSGTSHLHYRRVHLPAGLLGGPHGLHHPLVVTGNDLGELGERVLPVGQQPGGDGRTGLGPVPLDQSPQDLTRLATRGDRPQVDQFRVTRSWSRCHTNARPPDMPAAKLRPVGPSTTTVPPVMYSHPWSPTPSTTAAAPELRTANRSPTRPRMNSSPPVAPYRTVLPPMMCSSATNGAAGSGRTISRPPDSPLPT